MPVRLGSLTARGDSTRQPDRDSESPLSRMAYPGPLRPSLPRARRSRFLRPLRHCGSAEHGSRGNMARHRRQCERGPATRDRKQRNHHRCRSRLKIEDDNALVGLARLHRPLNLDAFSGGAERGLVG
ncbi:hypothetical protein HPB50_026961 [Hyalomma asiaticum]|uniref:Uncharacterized protein n=1 Tax=Hyalomma asiaticum TaxID=266040 RepID=A0ACB7TPB3_HYAAI|nr:hypothetical protein HPB50_026961 [Hyalomma asiaticum]